MTFSDLPAVNALLNGISAILLTLGFINIKRGNRAVHKCFMIAALVTSALFLTSYVIYHYKIGSVPYPYHDWTRILYFIILIPHVILAALNVPFIVILVYFALKEKFTKHKKLARWVWPVWVYVSVTGVIIYLMLYVF